MIFPKMINAVTPMARGAIITDHAILNLEMSLVIKGAEAAPRFTTANTMVARMPLPFS